jgi:hypothetical protein
MLAIGVGKDEIAVLVDLADVLPQRHLADVGARHGDRHRSAEDGVGAETRLVGVPSRAIIASSSSRWLSGFLPLSSLAILAIDGFNGLQHALAEIDLLVAVAQFAGFEFAGRRTRGTAARARNRCRAVMSTSTVGLPRESRICRPTTLVILTNSG